MTAPEPYDHPLHRDEDVRIGRVVHAMYANAPGCCSARISGHPDFGKPDDIEGKVFLAIDVPPWTSAPSDSNFVYVRFQPSGPGVPLPMSGPTPSSGTWHWPRACPWNR